MSSIVVAMSEDLGPKAIDKFLAHYGRLGMHWGVRRTPAQLSADPKGRKQIPADPDAVRAVATQAKIKAAGSLNVVSSKDLEDLVKRMNLEQKYIKATLEANPPTKKADSFIKKLIKNEAESYFVKNKLGPAASIVKNLVDEQRKANAKTKANPQPTVVTPKAPKNPAKSPYVNKRSGGKKPSGTPVFKITSAP